MMPVYRYMDSHPNQRNQVPFPQYYSSYYGISSHMMVDQAKCPEMYESWPHGSHCAYPMPCHTCGNHGNFPGYYSFRPPMPHFTPSSPHHCCGHNPPFTNQYPAHYPFPPYPRMEQPKYEYDKGAERDFHCCGYPNHTYNQKDNRGVKIEEQEEPDVEKQSDSLVPLQLKNYPCPMVWIPPEYMKKYNEHRKPFESMVADQEIVPHDPKSHGSMRSSIREPRVWNGWSPLDINSLKSLLQGEDEKRLQNQQYDDKMKQFPFPIFWMPSNKEQEEPEKKDERKMNGWFPLDASNFKPLMQGGDEKRQNQKIEDKMRQFPYPIIWMPPDNSKQGEAEKEDQREVNAAPISAKEPLYSFKFIPVNPRHSDDGNSKSKINKETSEGQVKSSQMKENTANQKGIPVKQVEVHKEDNSEDSEEKIRDVTEKRAEISTDNSSGTGTKRQSSSPPKLSKLPPVCLRVEPLPRKKNGNGSSRSPSHPGPKGRSQEPGTDTSKPSASSSLIENSPLGKQAPDISLKKGEVIEPEKHERKTINAVDAKPSEYKNDDLGNESETKISVDCLVDSQEEVSRELSTETIGKDSNECKTEEDKGVRCERNMMVKGTTNPKTASGSTESAYDGHRARMKDLSDVEAATLIQSAYRGFEVRKLEPLKKLKQMARVREQLVEVRNRIQALESSDLQKNDKERVVIGEMIMSLLLKLDFIQGLHPNLREFRKVLAKELVTLQEKLDYLTMKKPKESFEDVFTTTKPADDPNIDDTHSNGSVQETQNEEGIVENKLETSPGTDVNMTDHDHGELSQMESHVSNSQGQEISEQPFEDVSTTTKPADDPNIDDTHSNGSVQETQNEEGIVENKLETSPGIDVNMTDHDHGELSQMESHVSNSQGQEISEQPSLASNALHEICESEVRELSATTAKNSRVSELGGTGVIAAETTDRNDVTPELEQSVELPLISEEKSSSEELKNANGEDEDNVGRKSDGMDKSTELSPQMIDGEPAVSELEKNEIVVEEKDEILDNDLKSGMFSSLTPTGTEVENAEPEVDSVTGADKDRETNLLTELSLGIIEDGLAVSASGKHNQIETAAKVEVLATDTTLPMDETSTLNEVDQRSLNVVSDDNPKVMTEELPGNAALEIQESKLLISTAQEENSGKVEESDHSMVDVDATPLLEEAIRSIATSESEEKKEDHVQQEPYGNEEEDVLEKKPQQQEPHEVVEKPQECQETENPRTWRRSVEEYDKKLIEERAKLREMMEKLMEAGKEQLSVLSNLTGRVNDLERKLSNKKRLRPSRLAKPTPSSTKLHRNAHQV